MWFEPSIPKKEGHVVSFRQKPVEVACIIDGTDAVRGRGGPGLIPGLYEKVSFASVLIFCNPRGPTFAGIINMIAVRSEEHTSDIQSLMRISYAVFCFNTNKSLNS